MNMKHILQNCWFQKLCVSGYSMSGVTRSELTVTSRRELEPQVEVQCQNWKTQQYIRLPPFVLNIQIQARSFWASAITNLSRAKRCHFSPLFIHTTHGDIWQGGQIGQNWAASQVTSGQNNKNCRHCEQWPFPVARFKQAACDTCSEKNGGARGSLLLIHFFPLWPFPLVIKRTQRQKRVLSKGVA